MKISKVILLASALLLVACNSNAITSSEAPASTVISSSVDSSEESTSSTSESTSASSVESSSSSSSSISSSETPVADKTLTINLFNPTCGSVSTEALDAKLLEYINQVATTTFVSEVKNSKCQISNDIPNKGEKILIIGSASAQGSLEFTFVETIKSVTITAQTYHKPYMDYATGNTNPNVDTDSVLYINDTNTVDLKPVNGEPVEKEYTAELNAKTLKLTNSGEAKSRVFIKSLTFVY
jgi:hypothetical protein